MSDSTEAPTLHDYPAAPVGDGPSDSGLFAGELPSESGVVLVGPPSDSGIAPSVSTSESGVVLVGPPSDSGIVVQADAPPSTATPDFDWAFRRGVAIRIHDVLVKAYGSRRQHVQAEAKERGVSVEHLLAAYLARVIMDKVDREYL